MKDAPRDSLQSARKNRRGRLSRPFLRPGEKCENHSLRSRTKNILAAGKCCGRDGAAAREGVQGSRLNRDAAATPRSPARAAAINRDFPKVFVAIVATPLAALREEPTRRVRLRRAVRGVELFAGRRLCERPSLSPTSDTAPLYLSQRLADKLHVIISPSRPRATTCGPDRLRATR